MSDVLAPAPAVGPAVGPDGAIAGRRLLVDIAAPAYLVLYLVVAFAPFELLVVLPGVASTGVVPVAGLAVLALTPLERLRRIPVCWSLAFLVSWMALSSLWTENPSSTSYLVRSQGPTLVILLLVVGTIDPRVVTRTLLLATTAIGGWSLLAAVVLPRARAGTVDLGTEEVQAGLRGTFGHKNQLGMFMVLALAVVLPWCRGRLRPWAIAIAVACVMGTLSATAASGLLAVVFAWTWVSALGRQPDARVRALLKLGSIVSAVIAVGLALSLAPTLLGLYRKDLTFSGRTDIWAESLVTIARRPLQGYGLGGLWLEPVTSVTVELQQRIGFKAAHAHNGALELLLQLGVVGLVLFALLLGRVVTFSVGHLADPDDAGFGQWGLLSAAAIVLMSISEPIFQGPQLGLVVILWATLARARNQRLARTDPRHRGLA